MKHLVVVLLIYIMACSPSRKMSTNGASSTNLFIDGKIFATLFQRKAAEYRGLCFQAFNIARLRVDNYKVGKKAPAIITDIDETIFDNSAYELHQTLKGLDYEPISWYQWTGLSAADTVPGGCSFLQYAASKRIEVFYITNREEQEKNNTLLNLQKFHFPNADGDHLMVQHGSSSKETRRLLVSNKYDVVLMLGDNLADFSDLFDHKSVEERSINTDRSAIEFGSRFILLPNPVYGDWESALYKYNFRLTPSQKDSVIKNYLKSY